MKYRFVNADLSMIGTFEEFKGLLRAYFGYDINCQYRINWKTRLANIKHKFSSLTCMAKNLDVHPATLIAIGKFHLPAHGAKCQSIFSLNLLRGSARIDGEGTERGWSSMGPLAPSQRELGPGARHDVLDFHWSVYNWEKVLDLGQFFI